MALHLLFVGAIGAVVAFALVWVLCVRIGNYGFLDAIWSLSIALLAPAYAFLGDGYPPRTDATPRCAVAGRATACFWSSSNCRRS
jgi:steroid 5-alpha reductase family enzyme